MLCKVRALVAVRFWGGSAATGLGRAAEEGEGVPFPVLPGGLHMLV